MEHLVNFLNKKWSFFIAFIPGVNIAYLVFRFLIVYEKAFNPPFWSFFFFAPLTFLYRFVPDGWNWAVTHLIVSSITAFLMIKSRGGYILPIRVKLRWDIILVGSVLLLALCAYPLVSEFVEKDRLLNNALDAFINHDEEKWQSLVHPVDGTSLMDLEIVKENMLDDDIPSEGEFSFYGKHVTNVQKSIIGGEVSTLERVVVTGKKTDNKLYYRVNAVYRENKDGSGLVEFNIIKVYEYKKQEPTRNYHVPQPKKEPKKPTEATGDS